MTLRDAVAPLGWSSSKLSRIERAENPVRTTDVLALAAIYGIPGEVSNQYVALMLKYLNAGTPWWEPYIDELVSSCEDYLACESEASRIQIVSPYLIPDVLQTKEYFNALRRLQVNRSDEQISGQRLDLLATRQQRLYNNESAILHIILSEEALYKQIDTSAVMRAQLKQILDVASLPHVTVQITPRSSHIDVASEIPFYLLLFPEIDAPEIACIRHLSGCFLLEESSETDIYSRVFCHLSTAALSPENSLALIEKMTN